MSVKIEGLNDLLRTLDQKLGKEAMQRISDKALLDAANEFVKILKLELETFRDTGGTIEEVTITGPMWEDETRVIKVHWRGPKGRYRIIHLNEWGTINNPNPRGKGAIARSLKRAERVYRETVKKTIMEGL